LKIKFLKKGGISLKVFVIVVGVEMLLAALIKSSI